MRPLASCTFSPADHSLSLHPHGSDAVYCGVANPSPHSNGLGALDGSGSGYNSSSKEDAAKQEVIEAQPGLIESTELAPLGEEKIAAGQSESGSFIISDSGGWSCSVRREMLLWPSRE